jgi:hypothetical protein
VIRLGWLLLLLCGLGGAAEHVFLEAESEKRICYVDERFEIRLRIGIDTEFFRTSAVQIFQRELDVPVQVHAPWLDELDGADIRALDETSRGLSLALNGDVIEVAPGDEHRRDGRRYTILEIARSCLPTRAGTLTLAAPRLRFAYATQFREDFLDGRVPTDRRDTTVYGEPLTLEIRELPREGRPESFTGAVGRFTVRAQASPRTLQAGTVMKLRLGIEGEGNLERFGTPRLDGLDGFHVYGMIDDRGARGRTITYDLAPLSAEATEVPAIPFAFFDPDAKAYRTVRTQPLPLTVTPAPETSTPAEQSSPPEEPSSESMLLRVLLPLAILLAALLVLVRRVRQPPLEADPAEKAAAGFHAGMDRPDADPAGLFAGYLATRLRCSTAAVIGPGLDSRLAAAGVQDDLTRRAAARLEQLVAARYGAAADEKDTASTREIVDELEASFRTVSKNRVAPSDNGP